MRAFPLAVFKCIAGKNSAYDAQQVDIKQYNRDIPKVQNKPAAVNAIHAKTPLPRTAPLLSLYFAVRANARQNAAVACAQGSFTSNLMKKHKFVVSCGDFFILLRSMFCGKYTKLRGENWLA